MEPMRQSLAQRAGLRLILLALRVPTTVQLMAEYAERSCALFTGRFRRRGALKLDSASTAVT
jgi:hypothetical protein